jgi:Zn-dependent protease with chaperone function
MVAASIALAALAVVLAWPVPIALGSARWPQRSPGVALVLWQSIALAGGLSMIGSLLTFGLAPFGDDLIGSVVGFLRQDGRPEPWHVLALCAALLLAIHLLVNLAATVARAELQRRRHAQLVSLLSSPLEPGSRLIDAATPVAYCLPGAIRSVTVFSAGLIALLTPEELRAVIEHEKAHVVQRHDIVLIAFRAWHASLPWFPIAYRAQREVGLLIEMLADDRARRIVDIPVLARAIAIVGSGAPDSGEVSSATELSGRIRRLELEPLSMPREALIVGAAAALLGVPTVLLFAPALAALAG